MSTDFKSFIEEVRSRSDIIQVIGNDVSLKPAGSTLKGLSPFHQEKTPSFVIWPSTQSWHDYSNGGDLGGDVFSYIQHKNGVGFKEAVFYLAERCGVRKPNQAETSWKREMNTMAERRSVQRLLTIAAGYYHRSLPSKIRLKYYREHYGFTDETIDELKLGWADGSLFCHFTEVLGIHRNWALKTGLFVALQGGKTEDFFRNRLVFPYWREGSVVYFIARQTEYTGDEEWEQSKYKKLLTHSDKHKYVSSTIGNDYFYNEDAARGAEEILITEGITDCISARQAGVACISPATTRFRKQDEPKLLQLTRHAKRVIVCNDTETNGAGEEGARKTAAALWAEKRDVRVALIPRPEGRDKIDVNELVSEKGPSALIEVISAAKPYPEYLIDGISKDIPKNELDTHLAPVLETVNQSAPIMKDHLLDIISDKFEIGRRTVKTLAKEQKAKPRPKTAAAVAADGLPTIRVNDRQYFEILNDIRSVTVTANDARVAGKGEKLYLKDDPPLVFRRGGKVAYLNIDEERTPELSMISDTGMFGLIAQNARYVFICQDNLERSADPPKDIARHLVFFPPRALPALDSVIATPVFGKNGSLIVEPGFHREDHLWLHPDSSLHIPEVPAAPSADDVAKARSLFLDDLFVDFPLVDDADKAHTIAAMLLPFIRRLIHGNAPLHVVEAPSIGSGKGLLCNLISIVCTGRQADISTLPGDEEEIRKTLTAELLKAQPIVILDNAKEKKVIDSQVLTSSLTTNSWRNRILGKTEIIVLPNYALWMLTGNNPILSGELCCRSVRIRMDPKQDRAWQRTDFKHDPVTLWALENRSILVHAALVLVQAWIAAGKPVGKKRLGCFEHWCAVMDGLLQVIGVPGFLGNIEKMYADTDADGAPWREFTAAWWDEHRDRPVRVNELNDLCEKFDLMTRVRSDGTEKAQQIRLGKALMNARDRVYGTLRVIQLPGDKHRGKPYGLEKIESKHGASAPTEEKSEAYYEADMTAAEAENNAEAETYYPDMAEEEAIDY